MKRVFHTEFWRRRRRIDAAAYLVPEITFYPIILLFFGFGISAKIAFAMIHGIVPGIPFTMNAARNIRAVYSRSAQAMRLTPARTRTHLMRITR